MSKNRRKVWIIVGVVVVVVVAAVLILASLRGQSSARTSYQTTTVTRGTLTSSVEGSGTVASSQSAIPQSFQPTIQTIQLKYNPTCFCVRLHLDLPRVMDLCVTQKHN